MQGPTLVSSAATALLSSPHSSLRYLEIEFRPEGWVLRGKVHSYYLKQVAQETLRPFLGGNPLLNQIDVLKN